MALDLTQVVNGDLYAKTFDLEKRGDSSYPDAKARGFLPTS